eukprot:sb/3470404/
MKDLAQKVQVITIFCWRHRHLVRSPPWGSHQGPGVYVANILWAYNPPSILNLFLSRYKSNSKLSHHGQVTSQRHSTGSLFRTSTMKDLAQKVQVITIFCWRHRHLVRSPPWGSHQGPGVYVANILWAYNPPCGVNRSPSGSVTVIWNLSGFVILALTDFTRSFMGDTALLLGSSSSPSLPLFSETVRGDRGVKPPFPIIVEQPNI